MSNSKFTYYHRLVYRSGPNLYTWNLPRTNHSLEDSNETHLVLVITKPVSVAPLGHSTSFISLYDENSWSIVYIQLTSHVYRRWSRGRQQTGLCISHKDTHNKFVTSFYLVNRVPSLVHAIEKRSCSWMPSIYTPYLDFSFDIFNNPNKLSTL